MGAYYWEVASTKVAAEAGDGPEENIRKSLEGILKEIDGHEDASPRDVQDGGLKALVQQLAFPSARVALAGDFLAPPDASVENALRSGLVAAEEILEAAEKEARANERRWAA